MTSDELISIGKISGTHGYKGTIKVIPLTDFPERFKELKEVTAVKGNQMRKLSVESVSPYKDFLLLNFKEINSKEEAQRYNNALLKVESEEVYKLPEGYYYHFQLLGMSVFDNQYGFLGKISEVLETGANDVYVIDSDKYGEILIPAIKEVVIEVDTDKNEMRVELLPGIIE